MNSLGLGYDINFEEKFFHAFEVAGADDDEHFFLGVIAEYFKHGFDHVVVAVFDEHFVDRRIAFFEVVDHFFDEFLLRYFA